MAVTLTPVVIGVSVYIVSSVLLLASYVWLLRYIKRHYYHQQQALQPPAAPQQAGVPHSEAGTATEPLLATYVQIDDSEHQLYNSSTDRSAPDTALVTIHNTFFSLTFSWSRICSYLALLVVAAICGMLLTACINDDFHQWYHGDGSQFRTPWMHSGLLRLRTFGRDPFYTITDQYISYSQLVSATLHDTTPPLDNAMTLTCVFTSLLVGGVLTLIWMVSTMLAGCAAVLYALFCAYRVERSDSAMWHNQPLYNLSMVRMLLWLPFGSTLTVLATSLLQLCVLQALDVENWSLDAAWWFTFCSAVASWILAAFVFRRVGVNYDANHFQPFWLTAVIVNVADRLLSRLSLLPRPNNADPKLDATLSRLTELSSLRRDNLISDEEFTQLKHRVIRSQEAVS